MAEIDSLGSNVYYSGIQNAANEALKKNKKTEEAKSTKKTKFGDILHKTEKSEIQFSATGLPPEISSMSIDDATTYLVDAVNLAGNDLSEEINTENLNKFKSAVSQFLLFVVRNNYNVKSHRMKDRTGKPKMVPAKSPFFFSNYDLPPNKVNPRYQIETINKKLSQLTAATIEGQKSNLMILAQIDEIKGLIIDLMSS